jgi:hypothetical protein
MLYFEFWSHDRSVDLLIDFIRQIRPHEQIEIRSHDRKFDLMKKLNFDLMKFDLLTLSPLDLYKSVMNGTTTVIKLYFTHLSYF